MTPLEETKAVRRIRVLIVDDHLIVRKGVRALLTMQADIEVVGDAGNGREALALAEALQPDIVLMDLMMPEMDGIEATKEITNRLPQTRVVVLTSFAADDKVFPSLKAGALGYLLKDSSPNDLLTSIRQVYRGESSLHPAIARKVLGELTRPPERPSGRSKGVEPISDRELEVLRLIARGLANQEIADQLVITEATVRAHVSNILGKLHLASRTQAALYALKEGLASLDDISAEQVDSGS
jgi:NarL family two-component system response regulator LiaR